MRHSVYLTGVHLVLYNSYHIVNEKKPYEANEFIIVNILACLLF